MAESPSKPLIAAVIPTMGRPILIQTVQSLLKTNGNERLEIIAVGPIPRPEVQRELDHIMLADPRVRHLPVSFPVGDASEKRNAGYRASRADIVAFLDDDVYVPAHWPDRILEDFAPGDVGMVSGPSLVPSDIPLLARLAGLALSSKAAGYVAGRYLKGVAAARRVKWSRTIGCNMTFSRAAFQTIGGFNPHFYPGEEMIAADGVARGNYALVFDPEAYVYHYPKQTFRGFWRQIYRYGATRVRLMRAGLDVELTPMVPGVWVFSLVVLGIGSFVSAWCRWLLALDLALYALADLYISLSVVTQTKRMSDLLLLFINPFMHISYGVGIWFEIFKPNKDLGDQVGRPTT